MHPTNEELEFLAERIAEAYVRRRPGVRVEDPCSGVWKTAASILWGIARENGKYPVDPELFVAAQSNSDGFADPWVELTDPRASECYRRLVRSLIHRLRRDLGREMRRIHRKLDADTLMELTPRWLARRFSPLALYLAAKEHGRDDLAAAFHEEALAQHQACPLYRIAACPTLVDHGIYPHGLAVREEKRSYADYLILN